MATTTFNEKIGMIFRLLGSDQSGEIVSAATQLKKLCAREGISISDLNVTVGAAGRQFEEAEVERAISVAFERGLEAGRSEAAPANEEVEFFDINGEPVWLAIALFNRSHIERLDAWSQGFTTDNVDRVMAGFTTEKTRKILLRIFVRLGGVCPTETRNRYFKPQI